MSVWTGTFTIHKDLVGRGYFLYHDSVAIHWCLTLWGAKRAKARAIRAFEWNKAHEN